MTRKSDFFETRIKVGKSEIIGIPYMHFMMYKIRMPFPINLQPTNRKLLFLFLYIYIFSFSSKVFLIFFLYFKILLDLYSLLACTFSDHSRMFSVHATILLVGTSAAISNVHRVFLLVVISFISLFVQNFFTEIF